MAKGWVHNATTHSGFYAAESKTYSGPWQCWLDAESAVKLASKLLKRMGEEPIDLRLWVAAHHEAGDDVIRLAAFRFRLIDLCHEIAHVIHERNLGKIPRDGHDMDMWNLLALVTCVMCDVLNRRRMK